VKDSDGQGGGPRP